MTINEISVVVNRGLRFLRKVFRAKNILMMWDKLLGLGLVPCRIWCKCQNFCDGCGSQDIDNQYFFLVVNTGQSLRGHNFFVSYKQDTKTAEMGGLMFLLSASCIYLHLADRVGVEKDYHYLSTIPFYERQPGDFLYFEIFISFTYPSMNDNLEIFCILKFLSLLSYILCIYEYTCTHNSRA